MTMPDAPNGDLSPLLVLVDDDDAIRRALQLLFLGHGYRVRSFASAAAALADPLIEEAEYLVADFLLSESDGVALLRELRARGWEGRAVLVTAYPSGAVQRAAKASGYAAVLEKPIRQHELLASLSSERRSMTH
jgi:FixJ family two-component response regulator